MPDESLRFGARLARRWRMARAAALIRSVPQAELGSGQPHPELVAPRAHAAVEAIAHPAVLEFGAPAWLLWFGYASLNFEPGAFRSRALEDVVGLLVLQFAIVAVPTRIGMWIFKRRYRRMARDAYHGRRWRTAREPDAPPPAEPSRAGDR